MVNSFLQVRFLNSSSLGRADLLFGSLKDGLSAGLAIRAIKSLEADTGLDGGLDGVFVSKNAFSSCCSQQTFTKRPAYKYEWFKITYYTEERRVIFFLHECGTNSDSSYLYSLH